MNDDRMTFPRFATAWLEEYIYDFSGADGAEFARAVRLAAQNAATHGLMAEDTTGAPRAFRLMAEDAARLPDGDRQTVGRIMRDAAPDAWRALAEEVAR